jgi:IMP dehydrogenase
MVINKEVNYSFDDVLLVPQYSDLLSRSEVDLSQNFLGINLSIPILSAAMDTVSGPDLCISLNRSGGLGILHRFASKESRISDIVKYNQDSPQVAFSVGVKDIEGLEILSEINEAISFEWPTLSQVFYPIVNIDVAHGDHILVESTIKAIKAINKHAWVIAGSVARFSGAYRLVEAGADAIRVGIGGGSACSTRIVTGHGVPTLSSIIDCARIKESHPHVKIIADGGMRGSGDIVKALAAGADTVMLGRILAETSEAPGQRYRIEGKTYKEYRGQSTVGSNLSTYSPEGIGGIVEIKGSVSDILKEVVGGIKSGLSYSGVRTIKELQENAEFILISNSSLKESNPSELIYT